MTELAADILQRALGQSGQHMTAVRGRIINKFVDHEISVGRDAQRAFVEKQKLGGPGRRCVDALVVHHARADGELVGRAARRSAFTHGVDRRGGADLLRQRGPRHDQRGGERRVDVRLTHHTTPNV